MLHKFFKKKALKLLSWAGYKLIKIDPKATKFLYKEKPDNNVLYLNVGSGPWYHPYWTNLDNPRPDYSKSQFSDISFDLTSEKSWPIKDETLSIVYCSHTIEHLNDYFVISFMKESYKKLKKGGIIRLTCPDIDIFLDAYKRNDEYIFKLNNNQPLDKPLKYSLSQSLLRVFAERCCLYNNSKISTSDETVKKDLKSLSVENFLNKYSNLISIEEVKNFPREHKT